MARTLLFSYSNPLDAQPSSQYNLIPKSKVSIKMSNPDFTQLIGQIRDFEHLMIPAGKPPWIKQYTRPTHQVDVVLYLGCNILRTAHLAFEVVDLFQVLGVNFIAVTGPQFCCGILHHRSGRR